MKHEIALTRLKTIKGHVRGIERMVEDEAYCIDILRQIQAVQSALNKVSTMILDEHMHSCMTQAVRGENFEDRERVLKEIVDVYETAIRV